jgi:hypothetical protein
VGRSSWLSVAIVLAVLAPGGAAWAVRIERRPGMPRASSAPARTERAARWRDTVGQAGGAAPVRGVVRVRVAGRTGAPPVGIVLGPDGTERVERDGGPEGSGRAGVQIDRTRRMLELVRDRAERCGSAEARDAVRRATELQDRAESAERAGRHLGALQLTRGAREQGVAALRRCGGASGSPEGVVSALGRTDELLRAERERVSDLPPLVPGGRTAALQRAAAAQRRAHAEFRDGRLESSLRLTQEARQSLRAGARREPGPPRPVERRETPPRSRARRD